MKRVITSASPITARSLLRMWLISWASTPASSCRDRRRSSPSVMPITALSRVPVAKALSVMLGMT